VVGALYDHASGTGAHALARIRCWARYQAPGENVQLRLRPAKPDAADLAQAPSDPGASRPDQL
jgi:hypothetical protein